MTSVLSKGLSSKQLLLVQHFRNSQKHQFSNFSKSKKIVLGASTVLSGAGALAACTYYKTAHASEDELHPPKMAWGHGPLLSTLDMASVRRGFQVYQQVCAACHSLNNIAFRNLIDNTHTEEEARAIAAEVSIKDGPDENGKMFMRPGKLSDYFQPPYPNDEAARAANNGALPPDLSSIVPGRHGEEDYIFSLLTGYYDPPAGVTIPEEQYFNAYFPGQAIGMAQALYNEIIEYEDGTPATQSQLAKDVSTFLRWVASPDHDTRKLYGFRMLCFTALFIPLMWYHKKRVFSMVKNRKIAYKN